MKYLVVIPLLIASLSYAQLTIDIAQDTVRKYHISSYSYHLQFQGHKGYGAPLILTSDGGGAAFGDGDEGPTVVTLDKNGREQWKRTIPPGGDEMESQRVVQDKNGNYFVFILVYDNTKYRGVVSELSSLVRRVPSRASVRLCAKDSSVRWRRV